MARRVRSFKDVDELLERYSNFEESVDASKGKFDFGGIDLSKPVEEQLGDLPEAKKIYDLADKVDKLHDKLLELVATYVNEQRDELLKKLLSNPSLLSKVSSEVAKSDGKGAAKEETKAQVKVEHTADNAPKGSDNGASTGAQAGANAAATGQTKPRFGGPNGFGAGAAKPNGVQSRSGGTSF